MIKIIKQIQYVVKHWPIEKRSKNQHIFFYFQSDIVYIETSGRRDSFRWTIYFKNIQYLNNIFTNIYFAWRFVY